MICHAFTNCSASEFASWPGPFHRESARPTRLPDVPPDRCQRSRDRPERMDLGFHAERFLNYAQEEAPSSGARLGWS